MAAVSNLGLYDTATDVRLILDTAQHIPEKFAVYTDVISARALLGIEDYTTLQELVKLRTANGQLPAHWKGIVEYVKDKKLPVKCPTVKTAPVKAMPQEFQQYLETWNPLNLHHARLAAEDTYAWLDLRRIAEANIIPSLKPIPSKPPTITIPPISIVPPTSLVPPAVVSAETAASSIPSEISARLHSPNFAKGLFTSPNDRGGNQPGGVLGILCLQKHITFAGRPFDAIQEAARYRNDLIAMMEANTEDIVEQTFKGMDTQRLTTLRHNFPSAVASDGISHAAAEKIADLVLGLADPAKAAELLKASPGGYLFLDYDNVRTFSLKTEVITTSVPELSALVPTASKADFIATFDASVGKTLRPEADPADPNRYFRFQSGDSALDVTFNDLPNFIHNYPQAQFKGSFYRRTGSTNLKQEKVKAELKALEDILKNPNSPERLLLDKSTVTENLEILNDLLQNMKAEIRNYLDHLYPQTNAAQPQITLRMGQHEVEEGVSSKPFSNLHVHVEARIPRMDFGITFTLPIRVSTPIKERINIKYEDWLSAGSPGPSFIEYVTSPAARTPASAGSISIPASEASSASGLDLPEGLVPYLVPAY